MSIGIIGLGFVGGAILKSFRLKNIKGFEQVSGAHQDKSLVQTKQDSQIG